MENPKSNFSEWYNEIIEISGLSDKRYPIKGMNVWLPYGLKAMQRIDTIIRESVDSKGFQEVSFPVLITRDQLAVEFEHIRGFENEVYWVTKGGREKLDIELALRPTSEAAMYGMFSLWIRSHTDLPLRIYQIVSVYRYETKHTRTFIRIREIHFFEAHTAHATYEDAEAQMDEYRRIWSEISGELCLPYVVNRRPDWDKFPGAKYTLAFDTVLPGGRSLQIGTIHEYGDNFARNYDIKYLKDDGTHEYVSQTTFGMSERLLAAIIGIHGDDKGLIFPPGIAPIQVVVVPIPSEGASTEARSKEIADGLTRAGIRAYADLRENYTPGYKYNDWEMRGVPLRIEIGERELKNGTVTLAMRTGGKKRTVEASKVEDTVREMLGEVKAELSTRSRRHFAQYTFRAGSLDEIKSREGMVFANWCGSKDCSDKVEQVTEFSLLGMVDGSKEDGKCVVCGDDGKLTAFSKTY
ncbi:proline--tRNA ligase [Thermoplasmatales archaeon AK]|nr:proline--tRNA ligase [Thermoplasmatales archaeon AK]